MDLGDPQLYASRDRYAMWHDHATEDRIVWSPPGSSPSGFWSVFSHQACTAVLGPQAPFTSRYGMLIGFDADHPDRAGGEMIVAADGARHLRLREILGRFLSRSAVAALEPFVRKEVDHLLAEMRAVGVVDVARHIGPLLPAAVVCEVLGVPAGDRDHVMRLTDTAFASPGSESTAAASVEAHTEIFGYFGDQLALRDRSPGDDLISALLAEDDLTRDEVLVNCYNLLIGGNQTARHVIAGCFDAASRTPGLLDRIREDPTLVQTAAEEAIRWVSPGMHVLRVATADLTLCGQAIAAGDPVVAWLAAANRDPGVFAQPETFRPDRSPNRHLGFGHGPHVCLGARLARLEIAVVLRILAERAGAVHLAGDPLPTRSNLIQGYQSLPVEVRWSE
ncbi:cytochrome P450 [Plantactinospora sp. WMMB334]|uniref:cytochrome P450 n=1 Tax=Plantactinospora sp. WMMB334 TaxID=3404119 RepID=UPI003B95EB33